MNNRNLGKKVSGFLVWVFLALGAGRLMAATPADQNFNGSSGPGISSRIIGDWQFRLLEISGDDDNGGGDFVDVYGDYILIDDPSYTNATALVTSSLDNALLLEGTLDLVVSAQIRSRNGDPFSLVSFHLDGADTTYLITGYVAGLPVPGATQSVFSATFVDTTVTIVNTNFQNIEEFRIAREDGVPDIVFFIDDINVSPAVATSADPVIGNLSGDSVIYLEGNPPVRLDAGTSATVTDSDSANFFGGAIVVGITAGRIPPQDVLSITNQGTGAGQIGVSGANITYEGTLVGTFSGGSSYDDLIIALNNSASKTAARGILRALTYRNISTGVPNEGGRGITIRVYDGDGGYGVATTTVTVQVNNYPPTVNATRGTNVFNEGINEPSLPIAVDAALTLDDPDNTTLAGATVTVIRNFVDGEDLLLFTNAPSTMGNISASYTTNTGILTLSSAGATATLAQWTAALRSVKYDNTSDTPTVTTRFITFGLNDGSDTSVNVNNTNFVRIVAYNDAPVNTLPTNTLFIAADAPFVFSTSNGTTVSVTDLDAGTNLIQVSLTSSTGTVSLASIAGLNFLVGTGTNDEIVGFTGRISDINAALEGASYMPAAGFLGSANISLFTSDLGNSGIGGHLVDPDTIQLFVATPAPNITSVSATNANGTYILGNTVGIAVTFDQSIFVDTAGGVPALELNVGATNRFAAPYVTGSGTPTLLFLYTVQAGHESADLDYSFTNALVLNGGAISNVVVSNANLSLPAIGDAGFLGTNSDIVVDGIVPIVESISLGAISPTAATNVTFAVAFSEPVLNVDIADFALVVSGTATGVVQSVIQVGPTTQNFEVTIAQVTGDGTMRLDVNSAATGITDVAGQAISGGFTSGASYIIDTVSPLAPVFTGVSDDTGTDGDQLTTDTTVILHGTAESNTLVTITRVGTGVIGTTNANIAGNWSFDYRNTLLPVGTNFFTTIATDAASNVSPASVNFEVVVFDTILPTVDAITRGGTSPTSATNVTFLVAFSEPISGADVSDFTLVLTGTAAGVVQSISQVGLFPQNFAVTISGVSGDGTLRLDLNDAGTGITDLAGQAIIGGFTNGEVYAIDRVVPTFPAFTGISDDTGVEGDGVTVDATLVFHGTAESNSVVTITRDGTGIIGSTNADIAGNWSFDYTGTTLPDGTNVFSATATDVATNVSPASPSFVVIVNRALSLRLLTTATLYVPKKPAVKVDASATVDLGARANLGGGTLAVSIATNGTLGDVLSVYTATNSDQGITLSGTNILWGDLLIAQLVRGHAVTNPLTFTFTTNATRSAVQALVRDISFLTTNVSTLARTLLFVLRDGYGAPATTALKTILINKALTVASVTNRFTNSVGTFSGLVLRTNDIVVAEAGYFQVKLTTRLGYSGYVLIAGKKSSFSGQFNTNGETSIITSGNKFGIDLQLSPDASAIRGRATAYTGGGWTSDLVGHLTAIGTVTNSAVASGAYTLLLPSSNDPQLGSGWATITVDRIGQAKVKGSLADGQSWTSSSAVGTNGHWPLYASVDKKLGAVIGWLSFSNSTPAVIGGTLTWIKPAIAPFFTNGIAAELDITGSRYIAPTGTNAILSWTNGLLSVANGNLATALTNSVNITTLGKFTGSSGSISNLALTVSTKAGSFSGSFRHPASGKTTKYSGVLLQSENLGGGFFLGTNRGGVLQLNEAP